MAKTENRFVPALVISFCLGVMVGVFVMQWTGRARPAPIYITPPEPTPLPTPEPTAGLMNVYVNGAVVNPAIYELPPGSWAEQAIEAAGGFTAEANTAVINLAAPLTDGAQIYVPTLAERVAEPPAGVSEPETAESAAVEGVVNINSATLEQLDTLPGIGPSTAENIIAYREQHGPFATIEAVMDVPGIGQAKFDQIKELITVDE